MTLFIIGFALLLGLIITLEVKSRKREKESSFRTKNLIKESCNDYRGRSLDDVKSLRNEIARDSAMLYIKGVDAIVSKEIIEAKERGYFDRNFFFEGAEYKFIGFHLIKDYEITIIVSPIALSINAPFRRITIFKNGLFTALDFVKDEQILKHQKPNQAAESIGLVIEEIINTKTNDFEVTRTLNQCIEALKLIKEEIKKL